MRVVLVFKAVTRNWLRSRSGLFFSFLFPLLLLFLLGSVSGSPEVGGVVDQAPEYYLASVTAAFIMANGVIGLTNVGSELRRNGVLKRLSTTPLTRLEWILGNVMSQTVLALVLAAVMLGVGAVVYHVSVLVNAFSVALLIAGAFLFSGVGMTLAGLVKDPEAASGAANAVAFPMMLLSGTFWPVTAMPAYLQSVARVLPLTYFSEGLHSSLASADFSVAVLDLAVVSVFAAAFLLVGAFTTRWSET